MARVPVDGRDPGRDLHGLAQLDPLELAHHALGVTFSVDRFDHRPAALFVAAVEVLDLGLLDAAGVGQHDLAQVAGGCRRIDRSLKARQHQLGQQAGVVDVGVGQQHRVDRARIERK